MKKSTKLAKQHPVTPKARPVSAASQSYSKSVSDAKTVGSYARDQAYDTKNIISLTERIDEALNKLTQR